MKKWALVIASGNWAFDIANDNWAFDIASGDQAFDIATGLNHDIGQDSIAMNLYHGFFQIFAKYKILGPQKGLDFISLTE